jgi:4-aminobutyrate aminotransferase
MPSSPLSPSHLSPSHLSDVWFSVTDLPVVSGKGCWVTTTDGTEYLDFTAGIAVASTGHCHPKVSAAIAAQAQRFIHAQVNCYRHDLLEPLADRLAEITPPGIETFFYANSGAEITEAAVKLAKQTTGRPHVIVFSGSFHGRTHLTMAMTTSKAGYRAGHAPLPAGIFVAPFPDPLAPDDAGEVDRALAGLDQLLAAQTAPGETAAMIVEPVLGEGGYVPAPARFLQGVAERCARHGILFVADEVQTGFGRTGEMFAVTHAGVDPDVLCMAKGIASGFPFSALGARADIMARWPRGSHGGTYGGNPIGCAAALASIEVLTEPGFLGNVRARGAQLTAGLTKLAAPDPRVAQVRGPGLMIATEFVDAAAAEAVRKHCLEQRKLLLMTAGTYGTVVRWMPPLVVDESEISLALDAFAEALDNT